MEANTRGTALVFWLERSNGYTHLYGAFGYDGGNDKPSWGDYGATRKDGLHFQNLQIVSQGNDSDYASRRLYGHGVEYRGIHSLDLREAEVHARSLRLLSRRLDKIREQQGYPRSLGQFVGQVAQAVKATTFYFRQDKVGPYVYSVRRTISDAISYVDNVEANWQREGRELAGVAS